MKAFLHLVLNAFFVGAWIGTVVALWREWPWCRPIILGSLAAAIVVEGTPRRVAIGASL